jgi:CCR4-NOT transcription complex subunit 6
MEFEVKVTLTSSTPVVGCELNPWLRVIPQRPLQPPNHTVNFTWYRESSYFTDTLQNNNQAHSGTSNLSGVALEKPSKCVRLRSARTYIPSLEDLGFRLRLETVVVDGSTGARLSKVNIIVTDPVITSPAPCPRRTISLEASLKFRNLNFESQSSNDGNFSVLSYNVLADIYASRDIYSYCPPWALTWEYRRQNLLSEIVRYNADIMCLQEVQSDHFENFFKPEFEKRGYSVFYKKKTKEVYTANQYTIDGCATFFKRNRFKEIWKYELEFDKSALSVVEALNPCQKSEGCFRLMKGNIALVVILEAVENRSIHNGAKSRICVANTHIHANSSFPDAKLFQVVSLIMGLDKIACSQIPLLICADMNSLPASDPHKFVVDGKLEPLHTKLIDPFGMHKRLKLFHSMHLASAYSSLLNSDAIEENDLEKMNPKTKEPKFTNYTHNFRETIDYIFYSEDRLKVDGVLELLEENSFGGVALPSPLWSSDHIALMANFKFKPGYYKRRYSSPPLNPWKEGEHLLPNLVT